MNHIAITVKPTSAGRKVIIELDADKLERVAASLGMYNPSFVESIERAEKDFNAGRTRKVNSLKELQKRGK